MESKIPLTVGILDPSSTDRKSRIQYMESGIHRVESRIQDCLDCGLYELYYGLLPYSWIFVSVWAMLISVFLISATDLFYLS